MEHVGLTTECHTLYTRGIKIEKIPSPPPTPPALIDVETYEALVAHAYMAQRYFKCVFALFLIVQ